MGVLIEFLETQHNILSNLSCIFTIMVFFSVPLSMVLDKNYSKKCKEVFGVPVIFFSYGFVNRCVSFLLFSLVVLIIPSIFDIYVVNRFITFFVSFVFLFFANSAYIYYYVQIKKYFLYFEDKKIQKIIKIGFLITVIEEIFYMYFNMKNIDKSYFYAIIVVVYNLITFLIIFCKEITIRNDVFLTKINDVDYCMLTYSDGIAVFLEIDLQNKCFFKGKYILSNLSNIKLEEKFFEEPYKDSSEVINK